MKYVILPLLILLLQSSDALDKELYLLHDQNDKRIDKVRFGQEAPSIYIFEIIYKGEKYDELALDELNPEQKDTVKINEISSFQYKNVDWLTKKYLEYFNYFKDEHPRIDKDGTLRAFNLNKMYDSIYIIILDSCSQRAVITEVKYNPAFSID